jgi:hypothetical protein
VDVFVQGTHKWLSGWVSYGYLDTRRQELNDPREVPSSFGVAHSFTLVGKYDVTSKLQLGAKYNFATGRPFTPVIGRTYDASRDVWHPIYGENNSDQLPDYHRLDVRLTRLFSLPKWQGVPASSVCVVYLEAMNVLGIRNVLDYVYNSDYSQRYSNDSYFSRRFLVGGFALSW